MVRIKCNGTGGGAYFYLFISGDGNIRLKKTTQEASLFEVLQEGDPNMPSKIYEPITGLYLGWDLSSKTPRTFKDPSDTVQWKTTIEQIGEPSTIKAATDQKIMYLNGKTLNGDVNLVSNPGGINSGANWVAESND